MAYTPNPVDATQPTEDKFVESAAAEFRALKDHINDEVERLDDDIAALAPGGAISSDAVADLFSGDDVTTVFTLFRDPGRLANLDVSIGGVTQRPVVDYNWTSPGTTLTFTVPPIAGVQNILVRYTEGLPADTTGTLRTDLADPNALDLGDALVAVKQPVLNAVARTQHDKNAEQLSLLDFIPAALHAAILDYSSVADHTTYLQNAITACKGRRLFIPAGKYNHTEILVPKSNAPIFICGEVGDYLGVTGSILNYTGAGIGIQFGQDDGNPDVVGKFTPLEIEHVCFNTTTGLTNLRFQGCALARLEHCNIYGARGNQIECRGTVLMKILNNDIRGAQNVLTGQNICIWLDNEYFGNYVAEITGNHIGGANWAIRASEGRSLLIDRNTIENITSGGPANAGILKLETDGYISELRITNNYAENHRGWVVEGSTFTGLVLFFIMRDNEFWGAADAVNPNPGFGNLPRPRVINHLIDGNFVIDAAWNTAGGLLFPSVFPTTNVFDPLSTVIRAPVTMKEYEEDLKYTLAQTEMLQEAGDFCMVTGATVTTAAGGALTLTGPGATPSGWTDVAAPDWQLIADSMHGTFVCFCPGAGDFDRCSKVIPLVAKPQQRAFTIAMTYKGWVALRVDGVVVFDSGANTPNYTTASVKFLVPPNAASFTLLFGTNAANPFYMAECRLWEIGTAEYTEVGGANFALYKACQALLKRGRYS